MKIHTEQAYKVAKLLAEEYKAKAEGETPDGEIMHEEVLHVLTEAIEDYENRD